MGVYEAVGGSSRSKSPSGAKTICLTALAGECPVCQIFWTCIRRKKQKYRGVITDFVDWCYRNHLHINASKMKDLVIDFVNIQGLDMEKVGAYKYLGVHLNNKLEWSDNRRPVQEGSKSSPLTEETEVLRSVQDSIYGARGWPQNI